MRHNIVYSDEEEEEDDESEMEVIHQNGDGGDSRDGQYQYSGYNQELFGYDELVKEVVGRDKAGPRMAAAVEAGLQNSDIMGPSRHGPATIAKRPGILYPEFDIVV
ncbi:hypothetical protein B9Z55_004172 [Caenorhabditis nigoni]|nr:hypothetical protein B9Z55_004172 [Caenorhabditis nigoni]